MTTRTRRIMTLGLAAGPIAAMLAVVAVPAPANAFCGFYVSGAGGDMFNNATQVVLMREGTRTVLSMQNNYQGPPENFAMVVPVPAVLQEENVKTLDKEIFKRIDQLAAPRLVEYWEQDPCYERPVPKLARRSRAPTSSMADGAAEPESDDLGVTVEAQFTVGEYEIVILSAKESTGLDTWLRREKYQIPEGAEPALRPYVESGSKFFVAKVDTSKVTFQDGMAMLSPLRFYYDSDEFQLPVRLGMINSSGTQDLIVHVLAKGQRYEVANFPNVTIPTNLDVKDETRDRFGEFYAALFDATVEKHDGAVVTEYSWDASNCDPCPTPALRPDELATLGADVLDVPMPAPKPPAARKSPASGKKSSQDVLDELIVKPETRKRSRRRPPQRFFGRFVLTRLHVRYGKGSLADDLVFKAASPIVGGREFRAGGDALETGATPGSINSFQARYAIRHPWKGKVECANPRYGRWGGPPAGKPGTTRPKPALDLAFAPRGKVQLASFVPAGVPELQIAAAPTGSGDPSGGGSATGGEDEPADGDSRGTGESAGDDKAPKKKTSKGCDAGAGGGPGWAGMLALLGLLAIVRRRSSIRSN